MRRESSGRPAGRLNFSGKSTAIWRRVGEIAEIGFVTEAWPSAPHGRLQWLSRHWRAARLRTNQSGAAAVEFAIIAPVFFFLMFVIAETALVFIAEQVMDNAVFETARLIRTGQAQNSGMTAQQFKDDVCSRMSVFVKCSSSDFYLDVKSYATFGDMVLTQPTNPDDTFKDPGTFNFGQANDIVVVRAYYQWPTNKIFGSLSLKNLSNGKRLIGSFAAFRNEPYTVTP
jgi:Flp pilus assembly protein TadG